MSQSSPPDIGLKIKQLRSARNLTLDQLANQSGVSKSMLSQIERNKTNPTVATLWSMTQALGVDISELLGSKPSSQDKKKHISVTKSHQTPEIQSADGKCTLKILGPLDLVSKVEWYDVFIEQGGILESDPHVKGTKEHLTVLDGDISVTSDEQEMILSTGDTARYDADVDHSIRNISKKTAHVILLVHSPK
ncbi:MAG: helix-turn-helix transcriptional regulator [Alphaproteobacteria bacterium]|nr:helix-turn-helix transcriptional regulator [Alphaproteobacteria bacterium]HPF47426.1 XRE family transcriptional regulator [Emcibacteraceae bacterium]HRW30143.1 XRE family transcriptional regulator [Emcibacteraceae bacterium]